MFVNRYLPYKSTLLVFTSRTDLLPVVKLNAVVSFFAAADVNDQYKGVVGKIMYYNSNYILHYLKTLLLTFLQGITSLLFRQ